MTTKDEKKTENDLRHGMKGSLQTPQVPLAGGEPLYGVEDPTLVGPGSATPAGQSTHE